MNDFPRHTVATADAAVRATLEASQRQLATRGQPDDGTLASFFAAGFGHKQALEVVLAAGTLTLSIFSNRMTRAAIDVELRSAA
jgi:hypothetical protein